MGLTGYQKARRRISEPAPVVTVEALKPLSWSPDGIAVEECEAGDVVDLPAQIADAYIEQGHAVPAEAEIAAAPEPAQEPEEPEAAPTPTEEPAAPESDAQGNEDEGSSDDEDGDEDAQGEEPAVEPEPVDEAQVQADALAALIGRGKAELHAAAKVHEVKVHPNAGAEKVARALLEAGVTLADD